TKIWFNSNTTMAEPTTAGGSASDPNATRTVHAYISDLQDLIKTAQEDWGLTAETQFSSDQALAKSTKVTDSANAIHPLGPVNVGRLASEFKQKIDAVRNILKTFQETTLNQASLESNLDSSLRKLLQNESKNLRAVSEVQESIKACKALALNATQYGVACPDMILKQIERVADDLGLKYTSDEETPSTSTLAGHLIVIDIDFDPKTYAITHVRFTRASDKGEENQVNSLLTSQLRSKDLKSFKTNLSALAKMDALYKIHSVDFYSAVKCIANDIRSIYEKEHAACMGNTPRILLDGHGIALSNVDRVGPSIAYWTTKYNILDIDWAPFAEANLKGVDHDILRSFHRLWVNIEESQSVNKFLPSDSSHYLLEDDANEDALKEQYDITTSDITFSILPTPLKFIHPKASSLPSARVHFVAVLEPPVYVSDSVARALGNLAAITSRGFIVTSAYEKRDNRGLALEHLLIQDAVPEPTLTALNKALSPETRWEMLLEDSTYVQVYSFENLFLTSAKKIQRIPFTHPDQLYGFTKLLRQQLVFNTLFQSCFNANSYRSTLSTMHSCFEASLAEALYSVPARVHVKVETQEPPNRIFVTLPNISNGSFITLQIQIAPEDAQPYVMCHADDVQLDHARLTRILQACQNIPMLVRCILNALTGTIPMVTESEAPIDVIMADPVELNFVL
ncbi:9911_t:CDS:10, partial [Paraglomus occultum]